jgi:hypothetical protein
MKRAAQQGLCKVCYLTPARPRGWCAKCKESYDRHNRNSDGSVLAAIMWGVNRARWAAAERSRRFRERPMTASIHELATHGETVSLVRRTGVRK